MRWEAHAASTEEQCMQGLGRQTSRQEPTIRFGSCREDIKMDFNYIGWGGGAVDPGSGRSPVAGSCEHGTELWVCIR
jgi:hypothetical protein